MIQPYLYGVNNGEYSCIYISGINTHNMIRYPGIFTEKRHSEYLKTIPQKVKKLADKVASIPEYRNHLYMRVDIVVDNNIPQGGEVELAEPDLLTRHLPKIRASKIINDLAANLVKRL